MSDQADQITALMADVERLETLLIATNDACFVLAGILSRAMVDVGIVQRGELADTIEASAGPVDAETHNRLLRTFARSVRMNFPGGRFEVIEGGRAVEVDPDTR